MPRVHPLEPILLLLLVLLPAGPVAGVLVAQSRGRPTPGLSARLGSELASVPWNHEYDPAWAAERGWQCQEFRGHGAYQMLEDQWCYRCWMSGPRREWFFYAFGAEAPACRLQQFRMSVGDQPRALLEAAHRALAGQLSAELGAGHTAAGGERAELGSAYWKETIRWDTRDLQVTLYLDEPRGRPVHLVLLARRQELARLRDADAAPDSVWDRELRRRLARELMAEAPVAAQTLLSEGGPLDPELVISSLIHLMERARGDWRGRVPLFWLAADRLAREVGAGLAPRAEPGVLDRKRIKDLERLGLSFQWNPLGASWEYRHDLLWRLWRQYPQSPWGEEAFLLLLSQGWDTGVGCAGGADRFRAVIREGERFRAARPESPHRLRVRFYLAQAYETAWSLGRASPADDYVDSTRYREGSEAARRRAVEHYQWILEQEPEAALRVYIERRLPRLRLGIDTNQRRFYCIYD